MNDTLQIIIAAATSSGFMSLIIYLLQRRDKRKEKAGEKDSLQNKMLLGLAHDKILHLTNHIIKRGCITLKEKTNLRYLYEPYANLGGNGDCETGYSVCSKLPVVSDDEAAEKDINIRKKELSMLE